ncbi:precorrin-4 C(11)-methyltransferase [Enterocloster clostridioformis]|uniref:precorrin-4 C(11)-methyltransferase n=1 Tax=Enterocloster clostridioformis TaxID=1531 RepID=UPI00080C405F|nr:precorrin-4 C(11)-methyltransferase [Enterocloster clostridioformis]ANU50081.1 precorrin-4 C(11)-methyltransferase [Lachnoclostridium sp. YL32]NDO28425.1 precorrin-4 C(11)-methyltransferase [Enterocloster clostridioformis]OXE70855.1 precorrin-4 C(11)-methyltransferase [Enterocloster clostridioformis]QQR01017.1 precorrin-4 C(11)-methyltransferase [Enterocloster clostridioformis]
MIHIVGAGPGAVDLITVRGQRLLSEADVVIYAGSLVSRELLDWARQDARIYDSATMDLEQVLEVMEQAERDGLTTVRLHTGDPCLYGAIREQMDGLDARGIGYDICPGVSSFCGAAAALGMEYTLPGISQSVVITRMAGRTPVPDRESIGKFAAHGSTMVIFLSAGMTGELSEELMKGGYPGDTPAAIVYKATWPDEKVVRCTLAALKETADREGIHKTALIVVGKTVSQTGYERSKLYDPAFTTGFRVGREDARGKHKPGTLYVVGMGPGEKQQMTGQALEVMEQCQVIAGYTVYVDLVRGLFPHKEFLTTAMTREEERCRKAFDCCMEGKNTAMICSGDAGVYGMAGLILELAEQYPGVSVRTVPGITAACAGAAVLGAPLMHDFAVISLSDRLTPLEVIWNRVEAAAQADFVICLYNPASRGRPDYFRQACSRILKYRPGHTVCGLAVNIGREGEGMEVLALEDLKERRVDMFTTVYIGNSHTRQIGPYMVTPRGYRYEGN